MQLASVSLRVLGFALAHSSADGAAEVLALAEDVRIPEDIPVSWPSCPPHDPDNLRLGPAYWWERE